MTGAIIFIGIILIGCLFVAFGDNSAPATTSCIENENLKKIHTCIDGRFY